MAKAIINMRKMLISSVLQMTPKLEKLLGSIEKDIKNKKNISGLFSTAEKMDAYLETHSNLYK